MHAALMNRHRFPGWAATLLIGLMVLLPTWAKAVDVVAGKAAKAPKLDGALDDVAWTEVASRHKGVMAGWQVLNFRPEQGGTGPLAKQQRVAYVCYDDQYLYVAMQAFTPDLYKLKAADSPFNGDCLEIHIKVADGTYFQLAVDINGDVASGSLTSGRPDLSLVKAASDFGDDYWSTEIAIPWKMLKLAPKPGLRMGFALGGRAWQGDGPGFIYWGESYSLQKYETILELE